MIGCVVAQLLNRGPADQTGVSVRNPSKADAFGKKSVGVRQSDYVCHLTGST
jgi:uncharacterized protein YbjT (DUF2867 family)